MEEEVEGVEADRRVTVRVKEEDGDENRKG